MLGGISLHENAILIRGWAEIILLVKKLAVYPVQISRLRYTRSSQGLGLTQRMQDLRESDRIFYVNSLLIMVGTIMARKPLETLGKPLKTLDDP